jgi:tRNA(Ile)-lysidine synthase
VPPASDLLADLLPSLRQLLPPQSRVVVAVSGGPDSGALLDLLARAAPALQLAALYPCGIDHGLRAAAQAELDLAADLARLHGLELARRTVQLGPRGNRLAAARTARYAALQAYADACGASFICLGHHADDQAETLLQRLCRGTSLRGLGGMRIRAGRLLRPLLRLRRSQLQAYVKARGIPFAIDPGNADLQRSRARLRHRVVPELERLNPQVVGNLGRLAERAQADEAYLEQAAAALLGQASAAGPAPGLALDLQLLRRAPPPLCWRALRRFLAPPTGAGLLDQMMARCLEAVRQTAASTMAGPGFLVEGGALWAWPPTPQVDGASGVRWPPEAAAGASLAVQIPGTYRLLACGLTVQTSRQAVQASSTQQFHRLGRESVAFAAERLHFGLNMRPWRSGDRLQPFGLDGHIKVSDLFTNMKVPRALRAHWPVLTHGEHIIWVVGLRRSSWAPIVHRQTRQLICLKATCGFTALRSVDASVL